MLAYINRTLPSSGVEYNQACTYVSMVTVHTSASPAHDSRNTVTAESLVLATDTVAMDTGIRITGIKTYNGSGFKNGGGGQKVKMM